MPNKPRFTSILTTIFKMAVLLPLKALIALVVFIDEVLRPIYRPVVNVILKHPFFALLERQVSALPRWGILIVFAVPFLIAEPLKLVAVILFAKGRAILGVIVFVVAQLMTFILVERIFHAGRAKLRSFWWFAWAVDRAADVRSAILRIGRRVILRIRAFVRRHA